MSISESLGERRTVDVPGAGTIEYRESGSGPGPHGPPGAAELRRLGPLPAGGGRLSEAAGARTGRPVAARQGGPLEAGPAAADRVRLGPPRADRAADHGVLHARRAD